MSLTVFHGLPTHVLLVHFVVVLAPLTALALVAGAVWPGVARRLGVVLPLLALVTLAFVPLTTHAGEWLRNRLPATPLVAHHASLGDGLLPWVIALVVMSAAVWWLTRYGPAAASARRGTQGTGPVWARRPRALRAVIAVLAVVAAVGAVVNVYRAGDSGAKATWQGAISQSAGQGPGDGHRAWSPRGRTP